MFVDKVTITVQAGKGGNGLTSWRKEKFIDRGGPDGGDGGRGGDVLLITDHNLNTLSHLRNKQEIRAENGEAGMSKRKHGKNGQNVVVRVPVGTSVWYREELLDDLTEPDQDTVAAAGGRGGFGNAHFASSTRRSPEMSELGEPGESRELTLELKLIADVGLVGLPNAGKSTLLSVISNARPEVADYPFTTLAPNLGMADVDDNSLLVADIPGLIEGASKGKGLGDEFLRHIERTAVLLHLVDVTSKDALKDWQTVNKELANYSVDLTTRPQLIVLTKIDAVDAKQVTKAKAELKKTSGLEVVTISAVAHRSLTPLLRRTLRMVKKSRLSAELQAKNEVIETPTITLADDPTAWWIEKERGKYLVKGQKIEGFAMRTDYDQSAGMERLRDILARWGINRELVRLGVKAGDTVAIAGKEFKW